MHQKKQHGIIKIICTSKNQKKIFLIDEIVLTFGSRNIYADQDEKNQNNNLSYIQ